MKKATTLWRRAVSLLALTLILVPMFLLVAYASSSAPFNFTFGTTAATQRTSAYKDDVGDTPDITPRQILRVPILMAAPSTCG